MSHGEAVSAILSRNQFPTVWETAADAVSTMLGATPFFWISAQWRRWHQSLLSPDAMQDSVLRRLVRRAASTRFGIDHDFAAIRNVDDFQRRVPLRRYEDFWRDYWRPDFPRLTDCTWPGTIPYFALTSGTTTGTTKYIPCSREMMDVNARGALNLLFHHLLRRPLSRILGGKCLILGGSTDLREEAPGILAGDLSGIVANDTPWWVRPYVFPPRDVALITDWETKIDTIARLCLNEDIRAITGTPNWLLLFFERLAELCPADRPRILDWFPNLQLLVHGGIDFQPYARRFAELLQGSEAELREVYCASEGFLAIADRGPGEGLRLIADDGIFFEFVPTHELTSASPTRRWLADAESGVDYAVVLSTCAGAWGYVLGDTVRFVDTDPPRILVTGRTSYVLSAFGEHLIDVEIEEAVAVAAEAIGAEVTDFCVTPEFPHTAEKKARHRYVVEFSDGDVASARIAEFGDILDGRLCALNADYKAHRAADYGLQRPEIDVVSPGSFRAWMKKRGQLGGQHKVPRIINDEALFADLQAFVSRS